MAKHALLDDQYRPGKRITTEEELDLLADDVVLWIDIEGANHLDTSAGALRAATVQALEPMLPGSKEEPAWFHVQLGEGSGTAEIFHGVRVQTITIRREGQDITVVGLVLDEDAGLTLYDVLDENGNEVELEVEEYDEVYNRIQAGEDETGV